MVNFIRIKNRIYLAGYLKKHQFYDIFVAAVHGVKVVNLMVKWSMQIQSGL